LLAQRLRKNVDGEVLFDAASRGRYSTDASIYQVEPIGVVVPRSAEAARAAIAVAADAGVPVLPRGAGSSQCGQTVGAALPDFQLTDQLGRTVQLVDLRGKVAAIDFIYTRCPLPDVCPRLSANFARLQTRFAGRDLVLLSIVIDPANDGADALTKYAGIWKADSDGWHFLTGPLPEIQQVAGKFDMNFYPDEALLVHSFHTAVIDRQSRLAANLEGNEFTGQQLGDLVETLLNQSN
jgi:cytochrome oxidase Cu insertion factor (SCO1/SenC/PrrC family)